MTDPRIEEEPAEHLRFRRYLTALEAVAEADEAELVAAVLRDEDAAMAQSAVVRHLDRRAARLLPDSRFTAWVHTMTGVVAERAFLVRRLREWALLGAIARGEPWAPEDITTASDWFQRTAVTERAAALPEALTLLAEHGRTRRVRNAATLRLPSRSSTVRPSASVPPPSG
ncbi:hypothetical protein [Streptomyces sp. NPDC012510]|uniref:hypothetical protein n=1 Tax=Streptomyces sp. NPDC012510 TaxID=3364838 RepID=UPI0036E3EF7A